MWPFNKKPVRRGKRVEDRFTTDLLTTELGDVKNISGTGMKVSHARGKVPRVGRVIPLTLRSTQCQLTLKCRVVWIDRRKAEIGFAFDGIKPTLKNALNHLGRFGFVMRWATNQAEESEGGAPNRKSLPDYYKELELELSATTSEVRKAYYRLARRHHPDASQTAVSAQRFQTLAEAYRVLRDPQLRSQYNAKRTAQAKVA